LQAPSNLLFVSLVLLPCENPFTADPRRLQHRHWKPGAVCVTPCSLSSLSIYCDRSQRRSSLPRMDWGQARPRYVTRQRSLRAPDDDRDAIGMSGDARLPTAYARPPHRCRPLDPPCPPIRIRSFINLSLSLSGPVFAWPTVAIPTLPAELHLLSIVKTFPPPDQLRVSATSAGVPSCGHSFG